MQVYFILDDTLSINRCIDLNRTSVDPFFLLKVFYLKVGDSHSCNHSKHDEEHASDDRVWDGDENGPELPNES